MTAKTLGINCTASAVFFAETSGRDATFQILDSKRLEFAIDTTADILALQHALRTVLDAAKNNGVSKVAILRCSSGAHGSSVDAIKAEGLVELIASQLEFYFLRVAPQSLPSALGCAKKQKWQHKAKSLFNANRAIMYWAGTDGAVCAAYKASHS